VCRKTPTLHITLGAFSTPTFKFVASFFHAPDKICSKDFFARAKICSKGRKTAKTLQICSKEAFFSYINKIGYKFVAKGGISHRQVHIGTPCPLNMDYHKIEPEQSEQMKKLQAIEDAGECASLTCIEHFCMVCARKGIVGRIVKGWRICEASKLYKAQLHIVADCENCGEIMHFNWIDRDKIEGGY